MDNYTGKIYFFKNVKYGFEFATPSTSRNLDKDFDGEYVYIGESEEISVDFITMGSISGVPCRNQSLRNVFSKWSSRAA